jgi:hypothetical protein
MANSWLLADIGNLRSRFERLCIYVPVGFESISTKNERSAHKMQDRCTFVVQALRSLALIAVALLVPTPRCLADVQIVVDSSDQLMTVTLNSELIYSWTVSTGAVGFETKPGVFFPTRMHETWYSRKYDGVSMPNSIFYHRGYAIHGTLETRTLGRPASRGCVRLHPEDAKVLFDLVRKEGMSRTVIVIQE